MCKSPGGRSMSLGLRASKEVIVVRRVSKEERG